jgi:two-component system cell cycle response regulator DivK
MGGSTAPLILVVDDHEDSRTSCAMCLCLRGFRVATAEDGEQALTQAAHLLPDLILMDLSLPVLDGLEATRRLRKAERTRHIPVVAMTGHTLRESQARAAGCVAVFIKPIGPVELEAEIRRLLVVEAERG